MSKKQNSLFQQPKRVKLISTEEMFPVSITSSDPSGRQGLLAHQLWCNQTPFKQAGLLEVLQSFLPIYPRLEMAWHLRVMASNFRLIELWADTKTHPNLEDVKSSSFSKDKRQPEKKQAVAHVVLGNSNVHLFVQGVYQISPTQWKASTDARWLFLFCEVVHRSAFHSKL